MSHRFLEFSELSKYSVSTLSAFWFLGIVKVEENVAALKSPKKSSTSKPGRLFGNDANDYEKALSQHHQLLTEQRKIPRLFIALILVVILLLLTIFQSLFFLPFSHRNAIGVRQSSREHRDKGERSICGLAQS